MAENSFAPQPEDGKVNVWLAMLMAFAGGIILNFMPCIFPILTLKAISLAQADYNKRKNRLEALMYTLGVVLSFLIIATVLFVLRAQGEQIGWGFQLQSPIFVGIMIIVFFVIFLMLLDIVHFHNPLANHMGKLTFERQLLNSLSPAFLRF
ncbi:MAG: cytochrome c biogenesis protein CcdA [Alphaproteobacteria bacterium]